MEFYILGLVKEHGREQLESLRLAPWASRRRQDLLELQDRLNPTIAELSQAIEQEVEKCPEAQRLTTHPGVGPLTALAFVLIIGQAERGSSGSMEGRPVSLAIFQSLPHKLKADVLVNQSQPVVFRNLVFQTEVIEQRF